MGNIWTFSYVELKLRKEKIILIFMIIFQFFSKSKLTIKGYPIALILNWRVFLFFQYMLGLTPNR